jgi:hypothetical protein
LYISKKKKGAMIGLPALALAAVIGFLPLAAHADEAAPEETQVSEEVVVTTEENSEVVTEEVVETPEETIVEENSEVVTEEVVETPEETVVDETTEEETPQAPSALRLVQQAEADEVNYGIAGTPYPNTSDSNKEEYWEDEYTQCFKHEGRDMIDNDHAYLINDGKTVVLKPYGANWYGDHWELIIVKAANTDLVTVHPSSGLPGYHAVDFKEISHYIVCKGATPDEPPTNQICETFEDGGTSTNLNANGWAEFASKPGGSAEYVDGGLALTNVDGSSKVSWAHSAAGGSLANLGQIAADYTHSSGANLSSGPGLNVFVTFESGLTGTLVGEPNVYGQDWWLTNGSNAAIVGPQTGGGFGSNRHGTIDEWLALYPDATYEPGFAFAYGTGGPASGVLHSVTIECVTYSFDHETVPPAEGDYPTVTVIPEYCDHETGGVTGGSITVEGGTNIKSVTVYDENMVEVTDTSDLPDGDYTVVVVFNDGFIAPVAEGWTIDENDPAKASTTVEVENTECDPEVEVVTPVLPTFTTCPVTPVLPDDVTKVEASENIYENATAFYEVNEDSITIHPKPGTEFEESDLYELTEEGTIVVAFPAEGSCPTDTPKLALTGSQVAFGAGGVAALGLLVGFLLVMAARKRRLTFNQEA